MLFLVDPQYDGQNKSSAVWAMGAYRELPKGRPLEEGISTMGMAKGKFYEKLTRFVGVINEHRNPVYS